MVPNETVTSGCGSLSIYERFGGTCAKQKPSNYAVNKRSYGLHKKKKKIKMEKDVSELTYLMTNNCDPTEKLDRYRWLISFPMQGL